MSNSREYISIVMAAYNTEAYIRRALDSVLAAADDDCEILIVDDGSTDRTRDIAHEYEERDSRVFVVEQAHRGMSAAQFNGVEMSSGDSIVFVDSDDTIPPDAIAHFRDATDDNTDIVCGNKITFDTGNRKSLLLRGAPRTLSSEEFLKEILTSDTKYTLAGMKFSRRLFNMDEWNTHPGLAGMFHRPLLLQLVSRAKGDIVILPTVNTYNYYRRPLSNSSMLLVRPATVDQLWGTLKQLPLPRREFVNWSLDLLNQTLIERGIMFGNDFRPAAELRQMCREFSLDKSHHDIYRLLCSRRARVRKARRQINEGKLSVTSPHLSFIVVAHNNYSHVTRTLKSIFYTGLRNIEVIIINDGSESDTSLKLNALNVRLLRVRLRKHDLSLGTQMSRIEGLRMVKGSAVVFVEAGGTVCTDGIIDALDKVDAGAEVALFPVEIRDRMLGFHSSFTPMNIPNFGTDYDDVLDVLLTASEYPVSFSTFVASKKFLDRVFLGDPSPDFSEELLSMVHLFAAKPVLARTSTVGFVFGKALVPKHDALDGYCTHLVAMLHRILSILHEHGMDSDYRRKMLADRLTAALARAFLEKGKRLFAGRRASRRLAERILAEEETKACYADAGMPVPSVDQCMKLMASVRRRPRL